MQGVETRKVGLQTDDVELRQFAGEADVGVRLRGQVVQDGETIGGVGFGLGSIDDGGFVVGVGLYGAFEGGNVRMRRVGVDGHFAARVDDVDIEGYCVVVHGELARHRLQPDGDALQPGLLGGQGGRHER